VPLRTLGRSVMLVLWFGFLILGKRIYSQVIFKETRRVFLTAIITNMNFVSVHILHYPPLPSECICIRASRAALASSPVPTIGTCGTDQRNCLALHVRSHQGTVRIIMLQERDQRSTQTNDLVWRHVHIFNFFFAVQDREITCLTRFDFFSSIKLPLSSIGTLACAIFARSSSSALRN